MARQTQQLASSTLVAAALNELNGRWARPEGVIVRLLECSMPCMNAMQGQLNVHGLDTVRRNGVLRHQISERTCIAPEMSRKMRPASLLRWDLPNAIFNGGRCVDPTPYEEPDGRGIWHTPHTSKISVDGFLTKGFSGHNVTSTGVGWVFGDSISETKRGGAFGHDAWTSNFKVSGTNGKFKYYKDGRQALKEAGEKLHKCDTTADGHTSTSYAVARLAARTERYANVVPGTAQHRAASYKWGFANSSWNCYHAASQWESAFEDQRAYALRIAKTRGELAGECSIWGSLYNRAHHAAGQPFASLPC